MEAQEEKDVLNTLQTSRMLIYCFVSVFLYFAWKYFLKETARGDECKSTSKKILKEIVGWSNILTFSVNGKTINIVNPDPEELLINYIRNNLELKGTKVGCEEGGCGACTVSLTIKVGSNDPKVVSANSCLRALCSNDGCAISTIEDIGSVRDGLSVEQQAIVDNNGTQCGYCTPGWVSNMYALNQSNAANQTSSSNTDIEKYLDGNICRCTGYKPILKAFKNDSSSSDGGCATATRAGIECCNDHSKCNTSACKGWSADGYTNATAAVEDIGRPMNCNSKASTTAGVVKMMGKYKRDRDWLSNYIVKPLHFHNPVTGKHWYRPVTMNQLCSVLNDYGSTDSKIKLVGGNTTIGITKYLNTSAPFYTSDVFDIYIDITSVPSFTNVQYNPLSNELTVGAGVTINTLIHELNQNQLPHDNIPKDQVNKHSIFAATANHLHRIAGSQVCKGWRALKYV